MRMVAATIALEKPEISISLPNTAPSRNTGKYSFRKPTLLSMNRPVNIGATSDGSVSSTAPSAAIGAHRNTLRPRKATNIRQHSAARAKRTASPYTDRNQLRRGTEREVVGTEGKKSA